MKAHGINARAIAHNSKQTDNDHRLKALAKEKAGGANPIGTIAPLKGTPGGIFPNDVHELIHLSTSDVNALSSFYNDNFNIVVPGDSLKDKVHKFRLFIG